MMARATVIYVVMNGGTPAVAFTVKHELVSWLRRNPSKGFRVWKLGDGRHQALGDAKDVTKTFLDLPVPVEYILDETIPVEVLKADSDVEPVGISEEKIQATIKDSVDWLR